MGRLPTKLGEPELMTDENQYPPGSACGAIAVMQLSGTIATTPTPPAIDEAEAYKCPTCKSEGFDESRMLDRCHFCDGTFNGEPPDDEEVFNWNILKTGDDPCDEMMPT